jgi:hypothetical protein
MEVTPGSKKSTFCRSKTGKEEIASLMADLSTALVLREGNSPSKGTSDVDVTEGLLTCFESIIYKGTGARVALGRHA